MEESEEVQHLKPNVERLLRRYPWLVIIGIIVTGASIVILATPQFVTIRKIEQAGGYVETQKCFLSKILPPDSHFFRPFETITKVRLSGDPAH